MGHETRGTSARAFSFCLTLVATLLTAGCRRSEPPPILLISIDTLRSDRLPAYGHRAGSTPHIDAFRKDAVLYESAWSSVPLTLPSHATVFSGLYPTRHGVRDNFGFPWKASVSTLADTLAAQGYACGAAVSADVLAKGTGIERGFGFYDDTMPADAVERPGAEAASKLAAWLSTGGPGPVFAFLHVFEPHTPYAPPEPWRSRIADPYDGEVAASDAVVGEMLKTWKARGLYDRALIVLFSDHGEGLGDHGEAEHGVFLYREAIQVPLLVKYPGSRGAGATVDSPVGLIDLFSTVIRESGLPQVANLDGRPLPGADEAALPERNLYAETLYPRLRMGWSDLASLFDGRWHYIEAPRPELYDLSADPRERENLAPGLPPAFRALRLALSKFPRTFEAPGDGDPERARKLAALGYLTATSPDASRDGLPDPKDKIQLLAGQPDLQVFVASGDDAGLIAAARQTVAKLPATIDAWRLLADALARQGKPNEAIDALEKGLRASAATALPAQRLPAIERLVILLARQGRDADAVALAEAAALETSEALTASGVARARRGDLAGARRDLEAAVAADATHPEASFQLGRVLLVAGDPVSAAARFEAAVTAVPSLAPAWADLGEARARAGDEKKAVEAWRRAVELDPRQYNALYNLGIASGKMGDVETARSALRRFLDSAPEAHFSAQRREARRLLAATGGA
jgi:arylsulfatase A-like enzyme/Tfp pilus assembly protein PilF